MKPILCIIESLGSGGAERQLCGLASMLKNHGYNVVVLYYINNDFYKPSLITEGIECIYAPVLKNRWLRPLRLARFIKKNNYGTVISYLTSVNITACIARCLTDFSLVVSERNTNQNTTLKDFITFNIYRIANWVVPNSYSQGEYIKLNFPFLSRRLKVIPNFIDSSFFVPPINKPNNTPPVVLTMARLTPQKNCLRYLEAIKEYVEEGGQAIFKWYGKINKSDSYYQQIVSYIKSNGLESIVFLNDQTFKNVEVYGGADVFCLPSLYEGCPNTLVESMCCGLPVICGDVCDNSRIVEDGVNGFLFNPSSAISIKDSLTKILLLDTNQLHKIGLNNREKVINLFSKDVFFNQYIKIIN